MCGDRSREAARASRSSRARLSASRRRSALQELQRHLAAEPGVVGDVDFPRAARTKPLANVVVQDGLPGQRRRWHLIP